ncbi:sugar phosphate isomerase/epimerase family protein [Bacillus sp. FJAT-28004]|uniref:sugar phosphate isomerase/epimerase family protein n=1 Tax=Bacillus sp. FJAT-28004 TaxID=1679165 RepID=UPI0006B48D13|nr:xylose isomerase [Bacillus sp. FJAT-28004]
MTKWNRVNDGSDCAPRLAVQQAWWAMSGLGENGREWSVEEKVEKIAEAGFTGIVGFVPNPEETEVWQRLLEKNKLTFSGLAFPSTPADMAASLEAAKRYGNVQYMSTQVMDSFIVDDKAVELFNEILAVSEQAAIPNFIETHRGTVTQDLIRTAGYVDQIQGLELIIDLSHYVVAGEMNGTSPIAESYFEKLLTRTATIHARVSNGEQVQIDVGPNGEHPMVEHFKRWWLTGMRNWRNQAGPGDILPFVTELGPPHYAITWREDTEHELEFSDRWEQALLFKKIAENLWLEVGKG